MRLGQECASGWPGQDCNTGYRSVLILTWGVGRARRAGAGAGAAIHADVGCRGGAGPDPAVTAVLPDRGRTDPAVRPTGCTHSADRTVGGLSSAPPGRDVFDPSAGACAAFFGRTMRQKLLPVG